MVKDIESTAVSRSIRELIETSRSLPSSSSDIGTVQLGFDELQKRIHNARSAKKNEDPNYTKAHYLLAGSGVAIEDIETELKAIEAPKVSTSSVAMSQVMDLDSQLSHRKEENILAAIEKSLSTASKDFDLFVSQNISMDWRRRKAEIYESFGLKPKKSSGDKSFEKTASSSLREIEKASMSDWGKFTVGHSVLGPRLRGGEFTDLPKDSRLFNFSEFKMREKFEVYANIIYQLNNSREQLQPTDLGKQFVQGTKDATDSRTKQIAECWRILSYFTDDQKSSYYKYYKDFKNKNAVKLRSKIVRNGVFYLQSVFMRDVNKIYSKRMSNSGGASDSTDSGLPTHLNKIKYFVESQKKRLFEVNEVKKNLLIVNDVPIWALIFYLIRAGCSAEALYVVEQNESVFKKIDANFITYINLFHKFCDSRMKTPISSTIISKIRQEFSTNIRTSDSVDPYRYAVYKMIGKCNLSEKSLPKIVSTTEDWLWTNFMLINEEQDVSLSSNYESYTLFDFQKMVLKYGESHFKAKVNDPKLTYVLVLSGLFELAVKNAFSIGELEAVHLAVTLAYYGLLRVKPYSSVASQTNSPHNDLCTENADGLWEINYARLIGFYTRSFRVSDTIVALEYLLLINLVKDSQYYKLSLEAIRELVIETKEFKILLGTINKDGTRYPGKIEERLSLLFINNGSNGDNGKNTYLVEVIEQAAKRIEEEGRIDDSLLLYQLSENHNEVTSIVNRLLGDLLSNVDISQPIMVKDGESSPIEIGQKILNAYRLNPSQLGIALSSIEVLDRLLLIASIKESFIAGQYLETLRKIKDSSLIPISKSDDLTSIRIKCQEINQQHMDNNLIKTMGMLLSIAMHCINSLIGQYNSSANFNVMIQSNIDELREMEKKIMVFAGMIQYKMSKEVYIKLNSLEIAYN